MKKNLKKVALYATVFMIIAGCFVGGLMIDRKQILVGDTLSEVEKVKGRPDQIWKSSDSPMIELWYGSETGKTIENTNVAYVYFSGIDYVDLYVFNENNKVVSVYSGGT